MPLKINLLRVGIGLAVLIKEIEHKTGIHTLCSEYFFGVLGFLILSATEFGRETFREYRSAKEHIETFGSTAGLSDDYFPPPYCTQVGRDLAARESGLELIL